MGVKYLAMERGGKAGTRGEEECKTVCIRQALFETHLGVEIKALVGLVLGGVSLNEIVVEKDSWRWNKFEQVVGIKDVRNLEEFFNKSFVVVYAISKSKGVNLLQLVHIRSGLCHLRHNALLVPTMYIVAEYCQN